MQEQNKNILIIGMSKMGKTHFGGQLYGRLETEEYPYKLGPTPGDLSIFKEVIEKLNQGFEGNHTDSKLHQTITLPIVSEDGSEIDLVYPDYGGEQIRGMIEQRQINKIWQNQIKNSDNWFLFIRLDLMENISDVTTKFYQQIEAEKEIKEKVKNITDLPEDSSAFYVELLQSFLSVKRVALSSNEKPQLTILLSCWDKMKLVKSTKPSMMLKEKMPLLYNFLHSVWQEDQLHIIGLSSLGQDLNKEKADKIFAKKGPENYGYLILPDGDEEIDITQILNSVIS